MPKAMELINSLNSYREENGLRRIPYDDVLCDVAFQHGWDQFVRNNISTITNSYEGMSPMQTNFFNL